MPVIIATLSAVVLAFVAGLIFVVCGAFTAPHSGPDFRTHNANGVPAVCHLQWNGGMNDRAHAECSEYAR